MYKGVTSSSGTMTIGTPTVSLISPFTDSNKMTMTFKTSRSSVSGTSTYTGWTGKTVTCPGVSSSSINETSTGTKTVYLYFNSNGGSSVSSLTGSASTRTTTVYNFTGWNNGKNAGDTVSIANQEVWANWSNGGSTTDVTSKASFSGFPTPTRDGYKFAGWYKEDGTKVTSVSTDSNMTLYAKWYPIMTFSAGTDQTRPTKAEISNVLENNSTS